MFEGFSEETSRFLWDLAFHNEKPWFDEHKDTFIRVLRDPFTALAQETKAALEKLTGEEYALHVSRIYRDARRLFGRGPYKDHLWFTLRRPDWHGDMCFYFVLSASSWEYGAGGWMRASEAECWRAYVDANPAEVERMAVQLAGQKRFRLNGDCYKRPKGEYEEPLATWYNLKDLDVGCKHDFGKKLCDPGLPLKLARDYRTLLPYAELFAHAYTELE